MATLDSLPPDQRAVLQLVLQRGRSYDEIADMLAIDRAAVRQRALDGFDELGPRTSISPLERSLVTDYLLGQLPPRIAEQVRDKLAESPAQRAWARVIAAEIGPLSNHELPEIPAAAAAAAPVAAAAEEDADEDWDDAEPAPAPAPSKAAAGRPARQATSGSRPPSSRRGGAVLLGAGALVVIVAVVLVIVLTGGSGNNSGNTGGNSGATGAAVNSTSGTQTATTGTSTTGSGTSTVQRLGQINLTSPISGSKSLGVAELAAANGTTGVVIVAQGLPANNHNAYGVWLYTGTGKQDFLGFYNAAVGKSGRLEVQTALPANYKSYKQILITLETGKPSHPGTIMLQGMI